MSIIRKILPVIALLSLLSCAKEEEQTVIVQPYTIFHTPKLVSFSDFMHDISLGAPDKGSISPEILDKLLLLVGDDSDKKVWAYDISYPSTDLNGDKLLLSARVYIPIKAFEGETIEAAILANHHIITAAKYCPTEVCVVESIPAWLDYVVVVPDMIGFGASVDRNQLVSHANFNAKGSIEALKAGLALVNDLGLSCNDEKLYNVGYSQGGQTALANLRYVSLHPELEISFYKTFAGCGAYDPYLTLKEYATDSYPNSAALGVAALVSVVAQYEEYLEPSDVFKEPVLSTYEEMYLSKQYDISQINEFYGDMKFSDAITDGVLNMTSDAGMFIKQSSLNQRVYGGWEIPEGTTLYMFGSKDDDYIPYSNHEAVEYFLKDTSPDADMHFLSKATLGHVAGFFHFGLWVKENWE